MHSVTFSVAHSCRYFAPIAVLRALMQRVPHGHCRHRRHAAEPCGPCGFQLAGSLSRAPSEPTPPRASPAASLAPSTATASTAAAAAAAATAARVTTAVAAPSADNVSTAPGVATIVFKRAAAPGISQQQAASAQDAPAASAAAAEVAASGVSLNHADDGKAAAALALPAAVPEAVTEGEVEAVATPDATVPRLALGSDSSDASPYCAASSTTLAAAAAAGIAATAGGMRSSVTVSDGSQLPPLTTVPAEQNKLTASAGSLTAGSAKPVAEIEPLPQAACTDADGLGCAPDGASAQPLAAAPQAKGAVALPKVAATTVELPVGGQAMAAKQATTGGATAAPAGDAKDAAGACSRRSSRRLPCVAKALAAVALVAAPVGVAFGIVRAVHVKPSCRSS